VLKFVDLNVYRIRGASPHRQADAIGRSHHRQGNLKRLAMTSRREECFRKSLFGAEQADTVDYDPHFLRRFDEGIVVHGKEYIGRKRQDFRKIFNKSTLFSPTRTPLTGLTFVRGA